MQDYWNDPPETPEPPECCDEIMDVQPDGSVVCSKCGRRIEPEAHKPDAEIPQEQITRDPEPDGTCPHGKKGQCDACDHASDLAHDAAREQRLFGR